MPSPTVNRRENFVFYRGATEDANSIVMIAPQFESASTPAAFENVENASGFDHSSMPAGVQYGGRIEFSSSYDLSTHKYVCAIFYTRTYRWMSDSQETLGNGGCSVFYFDSQNNYVKYHFSGSDYPSFTAETGGWQSYRGPGERFSAYVIIDKSRTPDAASATAINWADIKGVEAHCLNASTASRVQFGCGVVGGFDGEVLTGGDSGNIATFEDFKNSVLGAPISYARPRDEWPDAGALYSGASAKIYSVRREFEIGDGVTPGYFEDLGSQIMMYATRENDVNGVSMPFVLLDDNLTRVVKINLSATCHCKMIGTAFSGLRGQTNDWAISFSGTTSDNDTSFSGLQFLNAQFVELYTSAPFISSVFDNTSEIRISQNTNLTGAAVRNCTGKGLYFTGGPGDYSSINVLIEDSNTGDEITIADAAAGTYVLSGISTQGQTINIHNESPSNAITVELSSAVTATSTTAGGTVTIAQPQLTGSISGLTTVSANRRLQIYNVTQSSLLVDEVNSGAAYEYSYSEGSTVSSGDTIRVRFAELDGATSFSTFEGFAVAGASGFSVLVVPEYDSIYAANSVDGSSAAVQGKFTADYVNDEIDLSADADFTSLEAFSFYCMALTTSQGMQEFWGGITALDQANYRINNTIVNIFFDETAGFVKQTDAARIFRDDGVRPALDPTTGGSGVEINWQNPVNLSNPDTAAIADRLLGRNIAGGSDGGRTMTEALRANRNRVNLQTGEVYKEDDVTVSHTYNITRSQELNPIASADPD